MGLHGACKAAARSGFAEGWWEVLLCWRGSMVGGGRGGQAVAVVGEADKQMDEAGITSGVEEVSAAMLADVIRLPQRDEGG